MKVPMLPQKEELESYVGEFNISEKQWNNH